MEKSNSRIEMLKQFLAEDPADDFSEYALALEYEKTGSRTKSLFHLEQLLSRNADYLAAYYQCGKLYEAHRDFVKASACYKKGMEVAQKQSHTKTLNELRTALESMD